VATELLLRLGPVADDPFGVAVVPTSATGLSAPGLDHAGADSGILPGTATTAAQPENRPGQRAPQSAHSQAPPWALTTMVFSQPGWISTPNS